MNFDWRILGPPQGSEAPTSIIGKGLRAFNYDAAVTLTPHRVESDSIMIDGTRYSRTDLGTEFDAVELSNLYIDANLQAGGPGGPTWPLTFQAGKTNMAAYFNKEVKYWLSQHIEGRSLTDEDIYDLMISEGLRIVEFSIREVKWLGIPSARNEIRRRARQQERAERYLAEAEQKLEGGWYDEAVAAANNAVEADTSVQEKADTIIESATRQKAQAGSSTGSGSQTARSSTNGGSAGTPTNNTTQAPPQAAASGTVRVSPPNRLQ